MDIRFTFEELEIEKVLRKFVRKELLPVQREVDESGEIPSGLWKKLLGMELLKGLFPEKPGEAAGTFTGLIIALKELSYATLVPAWLVFENFMLAYPLSRFGSPFLQKTYLKGLLSLDQIGGLAFTEADTGSDPVQLKTHARKTEGGWVLNGSKRFITHSGVADQLILFARTGDTVTAFLVRPGQEGYRAGKRETFFHAMGFDNGDLFLENYVAPDDHVIGAVGQGFEILLQTESLGKVAFCSLFVGMAERALDLAIAYANARTHRGKPIGHKFQMTQVKLARMVSRVEAMKACLFKVSSEVDQGKDVFLDAAALKILVATDIKEVVSDAMEIHGAYGLSTEYDVSRLYAAAISAQVVMGSLDIQRVIVAKGALGRLVPGAMG